ncbi:MAG: Tll0287-like domain-containing protein [Bacteroidota bacterium]
MKNIASVIILTSFLSSCGSGERVSKEVFEEVNQAMEVKKLNEAEIYESAMIWGDSISTTAQKELIGQLQNAIAERGVTGAIAFCNVQALPILEKVSDEYNVEIRRASNRYRNPSDQPTEMELQILETYEYNVENNLESTPNLQKIENGDAYLYSKAIIIPGGLCLSCHGDPTKDIDAQTLQKLEELYPEDKATGHKVGDLRGMWSIKIPKIEVVKRM